MPRKDRTFTNSDLTRFACRNLGPEEQVNVVHNLLDSDCFPIRFTLDQVEKIICQHMELPARHQLMKRLVTENVCNGENKTLSCQAVEALRTAIDALAILTRYPERLSGRPATPTRHFTGIWMASWPGRLVRSNFRANWCA